MNEQSFDTELSTGRRFPFGKNWARFLQTLSDARIERAKRSTLEMLGLPHRHDKTFLDIGSGSGLFSLVADRLGATVHSHGECFVTPGTYGLRLSMRRPASAKMGLFCWLSTTTKVRNRCCGAV